MLISMPSSDSLIIELPWGQLERNPKFERMLRRRAKIRRRIDTYRRQVDILEKLLHEARSGPDLVLDVACGMGFELLELAARGVPGIAGLEIDPCLCEITNAAAARFQLPVVSFAGDACAIPLCDNSCGIVMSQSFFEHVYDVDRALREQIRVLRPGGRLVILDGNFLNPRLFLDLFVFYPIRTRGKHGGFKWLFGRNKVYENLYGYLPLGRDEAVQTSGWWRRRIARESSLKLLRSGTGGDFTNPGLPRYFRNFLGGCIVIAEKL